ncbi:MAG: hypothetical protein EBQ76_00070 [Betaproteobacteria bacterium]|nr:hypothetical protein [Betaproteobacteria bacterium]
MTSTVNTKTKTYVVARGVLGENAAFLDMLGRWVREVHYAFPHKTLDEAQAVAKRRGGFVCERASEVTVAYTITPVLSEGEEPKP